MRLSTRYVISGSLLLLTMLIGFDAFQLVLAQGKKPTDKPQTKDTVALLETKVKKLEEEVKGLKDDLAERKKAGETTVNTIKKAFDAVNVRMNEHAGILSQQGPFLAAHEGGLNNHGAKLRNHEARLQAIEVYLSTL